MTITLLLKFCLHFFFFISQEWHAFSKVQVKIIILDDVLGELDLL